MSRRRRAVLIALRSDETGLQATVDAMDQLARGGFDLVGIVDPADHMAALRMVVDGVADIVVATRPDHMPALRIAGEAAWFTARKVPAGGGGENRRSRPTLRAELVEVAEAEIAEAEIVTMSPIGDTTSAAVATPRERRTKLVPRGEAREAAEPTPIRRKRAQPIRRSA